MFANEVIHMMQRFTDDAQRVLSFAQEAALELGHDYVGTLQGNAHEGAIIKADVEDEHIVVKASK